MTDAPDGPAESEPERGTRRSPRAGDGGSPVGSTLSIVLAVIAVIAGFLILRAITDDDDGDGGGTTPVVDDTTDADTDTLPGGTTATPGSAGTTATTAAPVARNAATVVVANASGVAGSAGAMTQALAGAGYTMGTAGNTTAEQLAASVVHYVAGDPIAQAVAGLVAADMGGIATAEMPAAPPIDAGLGTATVLVMVGTDTANKTLADLNPASAVTAPARRRRRHHRRRLSARIPELFALTCGFRTSLQRVRESVGRGGGSGEGAEGVVGGVLEAPAGFAERALVAIGRDQRDDPGSDALHLGRGVGVGVAGDDDHRRAG